MEYSLFVLLALTGTVLGQQIISPPSPATGIQEESASFQCEVDAASTYVEWYLGTTVVYYYDNGVEDYPEGQGDYLVEWEGQVSTFTINNLEITDAGRYGCKVARQSAAYTDLLVLEAPSVSQTTNNRVEGSIAKFQCEATFGGPDRPDIGDDHYPELAMFLGGTLLEGTVDERLPSGPITYYTFTMEYNLTLEVSLDQSTIRCEISTSAPSGSVSGQTLVDVHYPVRNPGYTPDQQEYEVGQIINCTADGNPEPRFTWQNTEGGGSTGNRWLTMSEDMVGLNVWLCEVENTVDGTPYTEDVTAEFNVVSIDEPGESGPGSESWKIAVGVAVPICVIIIGAIVGLLVYTFVIKKPKKQATPGGFPMNNSVDGNQKIPHGNPAYKAVYVPQDSIEEDDEYPPAFTIHSPNKYQNAPNLPFNGNGTPPPNYHFQTNLLGTGLGSNMSLPLDDRVPEQVYTKPTPATRTQSQEKLDGPPPRDAHVSFNDTGRDNEYDDDDDDDDDYNRGMPPTPPPPLPQNNMNQFRPAPMPASIPPPDTQV